MEEKEEEARTNHSREMISLVRSKQQHLESSMESRRHKHKGARGRQRSECEIGDVESTKREADQKSLSLKCQGPEVQPVPPQLISVLRLKTFKEEMRRAAEVEPHDPAVCSVCEREQASLALKSFIRRKTAQLQYQTLKGRLNTHLGFAGERTQGRKQCVFSWTVHVGRVGAKSPRGLRDASH